MVPQGIIFDLDDTLIDSSRGYDYALSQLGLSGNINYGEARQRVKSRLGPHSTSRHNRVLYFKEWLELNNRFTPEQLFQMLAQYENDVTSYIAEKWRTQNRSELIIRIKDRFPIVVLTNETTRTQMLKINKIDPSGQLFQHIITSEEMGSEKPNLRNFEAAASRLGLSLSQCLVVGDSWTEDIEPTLQFGGNAIWTQEYRTSTLDRTKAPVIHRLDEILSIVGIE